MSIRLLATIGVTVLLTACAEEPKTTMNRDTMTKRQKDSVLSKSGIPGASNISKAQRASDSLGARARALDTIQ